MINKIDHDHEAGVRFFLIRVWLLTELDSTKSCYHLIQTMTKFEKQTSHWWYVFMKQRLNRLNVWPQHAFVTRTVYLQRHDAFTDQQHCPIINMTRTLSSYKLDTYTVQLVLKSGWWYIPEKSKLVKTQQNWMYFLTWNGKAFLSSDVTEFNHCIKHERARGKIWLSRDKYPESL